MGMHVKYSSRAFVQYQDVTLICRYFTVTMLNMFTIHYDSHDVISFPQTTMGRNLLKVEVSGEQIKADL